MPSGTAVSASPKLWIRSASSATEPDSDEDDRLGDRGEAEDAERDEDRADAGARALDRRVDQPVRVTVPVPVIVVMVVVVVVLVLELRGSWSAHAHASCRAAAGAERLRPSRRCST